MSWVRGVVLAIGASIIVAACWPLLIAPGINSLEAERPVKTSSDDFIAIVVNDRFAMSNVKAGVRKVDPAAPADVGIDFSVGYGRQTKSNTTAQSGKVKLKPGGPAKKTPQESVATSGFSILLSGRLADAFQHCDDNAVQQKEVSYSQLTDAEKRSVVDYMGDQQSQGVGEAGDPRPSDVGRAGDAARKLTYRRLWSSEVWRHSSAQTLESSDVEGIHYIGYFNFFNCTFDANAFWHHNGTQLTFTFPEFEAGSTSPIGTSSRIVLTRTVETDDDPLTQLTLVQAHGEEGEGGITTFKTKNEDEAQDGTPATSSASLLATYTSARESRKHDLKIFIAGIGVSVVAALAIALTKLIISGGLIPLGRRIFKWFRGSKDSTNPAFEEPGDIWTMLDPGNH